VQKRGRASVLEFTWLERNQEFTGGAVLSNSQHFCSIASVNKVPLLLLYCFLDTVSQIWECNNFFIGKNCDISWLDSFLDFLETENLGFLETGQQTNLFEGTLVSRI
jgi:hypothetical protein